ncbi:MAG: hypothetical protein ABUS56_12225 [Acidobacteriota bacterium]
MRLSCGALAWIALGAAAAFLVRTEQDLTGIRARGRAFDTTALEALAGLSDMRLAQQAYVAEGQGPATWAPRVTELTGNLHTALSGLQQSATTDAARAALEEADARLAEFSRVDQRARDYLAGEQSLMAGDVIFTEGLQEAAAAARDVALARTAEGSALAGTEARLRGHEGVALAAAGGVAALILLLLGVTGGAAPARQADAEASAEAATPPLDAPPVMPVPVDRATPTTPPAPGLAAAAALCTAFGRLQDVAELQALLGKAAEAMDAVGLVVWLQAPDGATLEPVLTHGYTDSVRARLPKVPRSADNAAAAAYRSGQLQIVPARTAAGTPSSGAVVAPLLSAAGCVGALSAEIREGGDPSEAVQALAAIVASQLAGVLGASPAEPPVRIAASS